MSDSVQIIGKLLLRHGWLEEVPLGGGLTGLDWTSEGEKRIFTANQIVARYGLDDPSVPLVRFTRQARKARSQESRDRRKAGLKIWYELLTEFGLAYETDERCLRTLVDLVAVPPLKNCTPWPLGVLLIRNGVITHASPGCLEAARPTRALSAVPR